MKTIIDTSILISFAKINYLDIISKTKKDLFLPTEVYQESVIEGENRNLPDATLIKRFIEQNKIPIIKVKDISKEILFSKINKVLSEGDSAVLALALQEKASGIIADDDGLIKIALSLGFEINTSPDLLLESFKNSIINYHTYENYIRNLVIDNRLYYKIAEYYILEGKKYVKA